VVVLIVLLTTGAALLIVLGPKHGVIAIEANEPGADAYVDGRWVGVTAGPDGRALEVRVKPGARTVEVKKEGFDPQSVQEQVGEDARVTVRAVLTPVVPRTTPQPAHVPLPGERPREVTTDGFVKLFNGKDTTGWRTFPPQDFGWSVEGGKLVGRGAVPTHLYTDRGDFADVHVRARVRVNDGGNGGLFVRSTIDPRVDREMPAGYCGQIDATGPASPKTGSLLIVSETTTRRYVRGSGPPPRPDEWFWLDLIVKGNQITVKVNAKETATIVDENRVFTAGHIAVQVHAPRAKVAGTVIEFETIEAKDLSR
jgi:hypothetical protein